MDFIELDYCKVKNLIGKELEILFSDSKSIDDVKKFMKRYEHLDVWKEILKVEDYEDKKLSVKEFKEYSNRAFDVEYMSETIARYIVEFSENLPEEFESYCDYNNKEFLESYNEMKYKKGTFGYWWTIEQGYKDIKDTIFEGDIVCIEAGLTSLEGCPKIMTKGGLNVAGNKLTSLKYAPIYIHDDFDCSHNELESLEFSPVEIGRHFVCHTNKLKSLKYSSRVIGGDLNCTFNPLLRSIELDCDLKGKLFYTFEY